MNSVWLAFITGLTTGGLSCLAVQGGLLASALKRDDEARSLRGWEHFLPIAVFLLAKFTVHFLLGALLGGLGSVVGFTPKTTAYLQIFAGIYMVITALRIADVHPFFRRFVLEPPRFVYRFMRKISKNHSLASPLLLGLLTVFIPCGTTQAMMVFAASSGSWFMGAFILGAFVLGTSPVFFALGAAVVELLKKQLFAYAAAALIFVFAVLSINGGLGLLGSVFTLQNFYKAATTDVQSAAAQQSDGDAAPVGTDGKQEVTIQVENNGYESDYSVLRAGIPVRLRLVTNGVMGCSRAFTIPDLDTSKILPATGEEIIEFTPQKTGRLAYSCSMGMYTGEFTVR